MLPCSVRPSMFGTTALPFISQQIPRAALHMLRIAIALRPGGHVIIGTFTPNGPERCGGLPVVRHDAISLGAVLGRSFELIERRRVISRTRTAWSGCASRAVPA